MPVNHLAAALEKELKHHTIQADDYFINHLFPTDLLPSCMSDQTIISELSKLHDRQPSVWNQARSCFCSGISLLKEEQLADWLNNIGTTLGKAFNHEPLHLWSHHSCNTPPIGASFTVQRKPDLILLDKKYHDELRKSHKQIDWVFIRAIAEVTCSPKISK